MSVHYKFKSTLDYDTVSFDGLHISVYDLKKAIFHQKRIGKNTDFDLQVTNAQTKEDYTDDNALIAKNTSLIVSRVPLTAQQKRSWERSESPAFANTKDESNLGQAVDLTRLDGSEDDKIRAMMSQSTQDYDPSNYIKIRGASQTGDLPPNYLCYKCHQPGHWIKNCPLGVTQEPIEIKKSTGIPRSFMVPVEGPLVLGAMMTPAGHYAVPAIDHQAYKEGKKERPPFFHDPEPVVQNPEIPEDLLCNICKDLLTEAVMIPCCGNSFCDECIRTFLLESEEHECPDCNEKDVSPETLIPNRFLRNAVMSFKNETGYAKRQIDRSTESTLSVEARESEIVITLTQNEARGFPTSQLSDSQLLQDPSQLSTDTSAKCSTLDPIVQNKIFPKLIAENEIDVFPPPPPGTEPFLPIPSVTTSPEKDNDQNALPFEKKNCQKEYIQVKRPQEGRPSFNKEDRRERDSSRTVENLRSANIRNSLSLRYSHRSDHPIQNTSSPHLINSSKEFRNLQSANASRYAPNIDYVPDLQRSGEDRSGTPTVDEPHLQSHVSVNQRLLLPYPPGEDRIPSTPSQNYNQPLPNIVSHNLPLLPDPYMNHRIPMYQEQGSHYGPSRYDRPQYQQQRFQASQPPRIYSGPPRMLRGMHHRYRGIQPPQLSLAPALQQQPLLPPPLTPVSVGLVRNLHNGNNSGVIDDPLEAFERMLREKDERDRRLGKHHRSTRSRSRTRSYSRSRSRSFGRRSPLCSRISRSRSPLAKRRLSRSPLTLRQRSRTPKRRSRSGSFSISRSRSYSRSQSPRRSISRERKHDRDRDKDRDWNREREPLLSYKSPLSNRDRDGPRFRESRERYNSYYGDSQAPEHGLRDRKRDLPSTRDRPSCRYTSHSRSSQYNIPPLLPHLTTGVHPPPLMSLGTPQSERKDYYDSNNRYAKPPSHGYSSNPLYEQHYKRVDDVAPPGTEGYCDFASPSIDHPKRPIKDDRDRCRMAKELAERERMKDVDTSNHDRFKLRDERVRERNTRLREKEERERRDREREREKTKDERDRLTAHKEEREERAREKDDKEKREKDKERDVERYMHDRRDDDRQTERKEYEKERYTDERFCHKVGDKTGRARDMERKENDYDIERERQCRHEIRLADRKKLKKNSSPYLQKQRNNVKEFSPERLKKKDKDFHEDKPDEKKKEKRVKDKKKKKDSEEKERKKKKKKERKLLQREITKNESAKSLSESEISSVNVIKSEKTALSILKIHGDIESNHIDLMSNTNITSSSHVISFQAKSLIMNPEPPELSDQEMSRQTDSELARNPPNPNFNPIPKLEANLKPIHNFCGGLDDADTDAAVIEKYSLLPNVGNENKCTNTDLIAENSVKPILIMESEIENIEKIILPTISLSIDTRLEDKTPSKDELLALMPELSKWERDDNNAEKLDETAVGLSLCCGPGQDESESIKVVTSEVLKRAENAIFQKAINAIRPIEIKKICDSRKILYQNPEGKIVESDVNREPKKGVNVTIKLGKNERNVEIIGSLKKSKLDRSKFKTPPETQSPTRLSVKERLGDKVDDSKTSYLQPNDKIATVLKPFLDKRNINKDDSSGRSQSPQLIREKGLSPITEHPVELSVLGSSATSERKVFFDDRNREREKSERIRKKNDNRCENHDSKVERDMRIVDMNDFWVGRTNTIEKERQRGCERNRDVRISVPIVYQHEDLIKLHFLKRKKSEEEGDRKENKKSRGEKKKKGEHRSRSKSKDGRKRKERKYRKDKDRGQENKVRYKNVGGSGVNLQIIGDKHNFQNLNRLPQAGQQVQRKIPRLIKNRKRSAIDEMRFEPDYSASDSECDSEHSKFSVKKSKLLEQMDMSDEHGIKATKRRIKSISSDNTSSITSSTESNSSDESHKKRKKKHRKHKKRKATKKGSRSSTGPGSDSTNVSSDGEKSKKRLKKSKNKSKTSKRKRKLKH